MFSTCPIMWRPCGQSVSPYIAHVVRMYGMLPMWSKYIRVCCPRGQNVSRYGVSICAVYILGMSHDMVYQSILSTFSACLTIWCINSCFPHLRYVLRYIAPCGQDVSRCIALIHTVHILSMSCDMLHSSVLSTWSVCIAMYCPCGQCHHIVPMWSECFTIYCISLCHLHGQYVAPYSAHVVRVSHHILHWYVLSTWPVCRTI